MFRKVEVLSPEAIETNIDNSPLKDVLFPTLLFELTHPKFHEVSVEQLFIFFDLLARRGDGERDQEEFERLLKIAHHVAHAMTGDKQFTREVQRMVKKVSEELINLPIS